MKNIIRNNGKSNFFRIKFFHGVNIIFQLLSFESSEIFLRDFEFQKSYNNIIYSLQRHIISNCMKLWFPAFWDDIWVIFGDLTHPNDSLTHISSFELFPSPVSQLINISFSPVVMQLVPMTMVRGMDDGMTFVVVVRMNQLLNTDDGGQCQGQHGHEESFLRYEGHPTKTKCGEEFTHHHSHYHDSVAHSPTTASSVSVSPTSGNYWKWKWRDVELLSVKFCSSEDSYHNSFFSFLYVYIL